MNDIDVYSRQRQHEIRELGIPSVIRHACHFQELYLYYYLFGVLDTRGKEL